MQPRASLPDPQGTKRGPAKDRWEIRTALIVTGAMVVVGLWQLLYDDTDFLPSPGSTARVAVELLGHTETWMAIQATTRRLVIGLSAGYIGGVAVALLMRQSKWWRGALQPYVYVALTMPSLSVALISLMVVGLSEVGVYISVAFVIFPFVVISLSEGLTNQDAKLHDMARVFNLSRWQRVRHQSLPEIAPYMFSAFRNVHALAWKIVIIAELFSQEVGIGVEYANSYAFFDLSRLVAWAIFFMILVIFVEYCLVKPLESFVFRWRAR